jgi:hypothetical protein
MRRIIIALVALITATAQASLVGYETTISNSAPTLWYKNATTKSGVHMQNSGSAGSTYQVYNFAQATYTDVWGTANMAFGTTNAAPAVTGSTGLFCTGAVGTVSFLFKTPTTMPTGTYPDLFAQGGNFAVDIGPSGMMRIAYTTNGTTTSYAYLETLTTDKWYYFAMKWDTSKTGNDLTWYLGSTNSTLKSGNLTIASTGTNTAPISLGGLKNPMQEIAIWGSELSDASIQSQFSAIPEPATVGLFGAAALGLMILRRRIMS